MFSYISRENIARYPSDIPFDKKSELRDSIPPDHKVINQNYDIKVINKRKTSELLDRSSNHEIKSKNY